MGLPEDLLQYQDPARRLKSVSVRCKEGHILLEKQSDRQNSPPV